MDNVGSPPSYQMFSSILRTLCAKRCPQEIAVTIQNPPGNNISHPEPTRKQQQGIYTRFSIISPEDPPPNLCPPQKTLKLSPPPSVTALTRRATNLCTTGCAVPGLVYAMMRELVHSLGLYASAHRSDSRAFGCKRGIRQMLRAVRVL